MRAHPISQHRTGIVVVLVLIIGTLTLGWAPQATAQSTGESGATVSSINHDQTVAPDGSFDVTVETTDSAGTTVAVEPEGFDVSLSSESGTVDGNEVQFLDVNADDSTHTLTVSITGGEDGASADIAAWVNADNRGDADDVATSTISVGTTEDDASGSDGTSDEADADNDADGDSDDDDATNTESETTKGVEPEENDEQTSSSTNQSDETMSADEQINDDEDETTEQVDENTNTEDPADDSGTEGNTDSSVPGFGVVTSLMALAWYTVAARLSRR